MKSKLRISTAIILFALSPGAAHAQQYGAPDNPVPQGSMIDPRTGLPISAPGMIDPVTGLPVPMPGNDWKDPNWKDPDKVLAQVSYDGLPVSEVASNLREQFTNAFDVLIPSGWSDPRNPNIESVNPNNYSVRLQLRNVTVSEIFNAMNLEFEAENTPVRWRLIVNGSRPMALLRVIPELVPPASPPSPAAPQTKRMIFFVGDLVERKNSPEDIIRIASEIGDVWRIGSVRPDRLEQNLNIYPPAQLIIVNGTPEQIELAQQTLAALRQKAALQRDAESKAASPAPKTVGSNSAGGGGSSE